MDDGIYLVYFEGLISKPKESGMCSIKYDPSCPEEPVIRIIRGYVIESLIMFSSALSSIDLTVMDKAFISSSLVL